MFVQMNKIRNSANAYYLLQNEINSTSEALDYHEKFQLNWDLYKDDVSSEDAKQTLHL